MAWSNSKVFARTVLNSLNRGTAINWSTDTINIALYLTNTPDNTVTTDVLTRYNGAASQWVTANEVPNTGTYTAGGSAVSPITVSQTTNVVTFTSSGAPSWTGATMTAVFGALIYDVTTASNGVCYLYFGGSQSVTAGTFTVNFNASGIATFTT